MKKSFLVLLVSSIVLAGCTNSSTAINEKVENKIGQKEEKVTALKKSLKDLLTLGAAQKCSYLVKNGENQTKGELIVSGKKFRQVTKVIEQNGIMTVNGISDGVYMYTWNDKMPNSGMKFKFDLSKEDVGSTPVEGQVSGQGPDLNQQYDYSCQPVTVSDADFALPKDIEFTDFTDFQNQFKNVDLEKLKQQFGQ